MTGIELIAQERQEQIEKHKISTKEDREFNFSRELILGAEALIAHKGEGDYTYFPAQWDIEICKKMIEKSYKERLIIAGALIAAELDRIDCLVPLATRKMEVKGGSGII